MRSSASSSKCCSALAGADSTCLQSDWEQAAAQNQNLPGPPPRNQAAGEKHPPCPNPATPSPLSNLCFTSPAPRQPSAGGSDLSSPACGPAGRERPGARGRRPGAAVAERSLSSLCDRNPSAPPGPAAARVSAGATGTAE